MKEIILFTLVFTIINIYIYFYVENLDTCINPTVKTYIILFYGLSLIYIVYLFTKNKKTSTPSDQNTITIDLTTNPEYNSNSSKVIYWGTDFNVNGIVDIVKGKVVIILNNSTSLKYRIIDINEKLSSVYTV